ncbi:LysR family transcriptional regulator [Neptunomonas sp. CHC150]|uniref:LysR family transcriptional regulator n=1 Tax=Neptunomonas sp. CHC150 TaxID=2998324 RepID=UPI0025B0DB1D|nr:LysR family transcriptional regulator [Neptunomonas sp. CHC150]MDN2660749.1 LysR family transcriptional regulator [Neptunomonas sp. CHC150]
MDLELLRTFLEVARLRNFGRAAEALYLTQAAVSARIKLLETQLDVQLFDRYKRDIRLTPEGNRLVRHAELLLANWRKARQDVTAGGAQSQLSLGGSLRLWDVMLQPWLHQIRSHHPEIALIAESHTPEVLTRRLLDGVLDISFMLEPAQLDVLTLQQVGDLELMLVASTPNISLDDALGDHYLMVDWGLSHMLTHRRLFPDIAEPHTRLGTAKMAIAFLQALGGSAYLPLSAIEQEIETKQLHVVKEAPVIKHPMYAVYPVRSPHLNLIKQVLSLY